MKIQKDGLGDAIHFVVEHVAGVPCYFDVYIVDFQHLPEHSYAVVSPNDARLPAHVFYFGDTSLEGKAYEEIIGDALVEYVTCHGSIIRDLAGAPALH